MSSPKRELQLARELWRRSCPDLLSWSMVHRFEQGSPLDFERFPFQLDLYKAFGDEKLSTVDVAKSAQCGVSAAGVSLALYAADIWSANVLYVFPTTDDVEDFSDTRTHPAIEDSGYLRSRVSSTDNKGLRKIGDAFIYFRGSVSEKKALSIPADVLLFDEYDRLDQRNVPKFRRRLAAEGSKKLERRFSNPSYPEDGIHKHWLNSDQHSWQVTCPGCGKEAPLSYDEDDAHLVDEERALRVCYKCRRPLLAEHVAAGRWVPAYRGRPRGYHISRLVVPGEDIKELVRNHAQKDETSLATHVNFDLGLPYSPRGGSIPRKVILSCQRQYECPTHYEGTDPVTMGVDVGAVLHVRISQHNSHGAVPLFIGEVSEFEELALLMQRYRVGLAAIDERPEERAARAFARQFAGRVKLVRFSGEDQKDEISPDEERGLLSVRRTWICDQLVHSFQTEARLLPEHLPERYLSQLSAAHRVTEQSARGQRISRYVSLRADHYFFAEVYDLVARLRQPVHFESFRVESPSVRERIQGRRPRY